ncbi:MAG: sensor histidine kinase [Tabrizicola sp.]|uniref:sensor histidine kinase n=1 Tax=Tabrizicola sp. TaxID=2005166 RepID=UPI002734F6C4|nr:sensor histidine kinase [Tabrizicola sp.]MDP3263138.1 sensor histidine kinase [Tabrizicola sp.]MDP3649845.1 sensor histidine kinase [Paracoccaceae bacterium]MDZ4069173.1 sensor histidine kinase [Tabrizicola sp.]
MTAAPRIAMEEFRPKRSGDVLLGEDWVSPDATVERLKDGRGRGAIAQLNRSPLARKIIVFNLMALVMMVVGILFMNPFRDSLVLQREQGMIRQAELVAAVYQAQLGAGAASVDFRASLEQFRVDPSSELFVFDPSARLLGSKVGQGTETIVTDPGRPTFITDFLDGAWGGVTAILRQGNPVLTETVDAAVVAAALVPVATSGNTSVRTVTDPEGNAIFAAAAPISLGGEVIGVVAITSSSNEIDRLVRYEREQILQIFVLALIVSVGLSLMLASTISNPLSDLAAAAEIGRNRDARRVAPSRVRIPDLAARPDEIGRLSVAMRGMVTALYDRIDANEQFAADVAHEIKNPLASLRSAVGSLRFVKKEAQRETLLDVIDHDVRRLDRLVSDISNASRLDSELVKEEEEEFNLIKTLTNLCQYLSQQAGEKGVDFIIDLPSEPINTHGLEARLAQVFVNLVTNAISFCEDGDAVRVWARRRENRVLVVVEDTGPGIPEEALTKIFKRFYSERPKGDFGNHSGLGLAISKQIIEAHGGVIWAENIRPTAADPTSPPLGARFVIGLPV